MKLFHRPTVNILMTIPASTVIAALVLLSSLAIAQDAPKSLTNPPSTRPTTEPAASPAARIAARTFPSVFMAWNIADNLKEDKISIITRHDLAFLSPETIGFKFEGPYRELSTTFTPKSIQAGLKFRAALLAKNPNLVLLTEIKYHDVLPTQLPADSPFFLRKNGKLVPKKQNPSYMMLDISSPDLQAHVAAQIKAVMATGVVDGIMFDWWLDDAPHLALVKKVREEIGPDPLIIVNTNDRPTPMTATYINGYFMEGYRSQTPEDWRRLADTAIFGQHNLREPRMVCLETWYHNSRNDLNLMRATTTLSLTMTDGFCLFSDPNSLPTPDHLHNWYDFWEKSLGKPVKEGSWQPDGSARREFENGTVVYNPMGNKPVTVMFEKPHEQLSTKAVGMSFTVPALDGDIFLKRPPN